MAGALKINPGTKLRMAFDVPIGQEPKFNMICTFNKSLDESAFLVSIPMVGEKHWSLTRIRSCCLSTATERKRALLPDM